MMSWQDNGTLSPCPPFPPLQTAGQTTQGHFYFPRRPRSTAGTLASQTLARGFVPRQCRSMGGGGMPRPWRSLPIIPLLINIHIDAVFRAIISYPHPSRAPVRLRRGDPFVLSPSSSSFFFLRALLAADGSVQKQAVQRSSGRAWALVGGAAARASPWGGAAEGRDADKLDGRASRQAVKAPAGDHPDGPAGSRSLPKTRAERESERNGENYSPR